MSDYNGYVIEVDGTFGLKVIKAKGSGALPNILKGSFTSEAFAQRAIDLYLNNKDSVDVEKVRTSRG